VSITRRHRPEGALQPATAGERETVIALNNDDGIARIYTLQPCVIAKLRRNPAAVLVSEGNSEGMEWAEFTMPAESISRRPAMAYAA
jgi:hypothetical protein